MPLHGMPRHGIKGAEARLTIGCVRKCVGGLAKWTSYSRSFANSAMNKLVLDASVALKTLLSEPGSPQAAAILTDYINGVRELIPLAVDLAMI